MDRRQFSMSASAMFLTGCVTGGRRSSGVQSGEDNLGSPPAERGEIAGLPFEWVRFNKEGAVTPQIPTLLQDSTITDFIVISHGWLTDLNGAWGFYKPLLENVAQTWGSGAAALAAGRKYAILGVSWPSKQWGARAHDPRSVIVSADSRERVSRLDAAALRRAITDYASFTGADPVELHRLARAAIGGGLEQGDCEALMRAAMAPVSAQSDAELRADIASYELDRAQEIMRSLSAPLRLNLDPAVAIAQGVNPAQRGRYQGGVWAVDRLLNFLTYHEMKARAGLVGRALAERVLPQLNGAPGVQRVHLIGHSFGARLVTAACHQASDSAKLRSLVLLQGAFSHNGLSDAGGFAGAHRKISGATLITHTHRDRALALLYPIASLQSGDTSRRLGGPSDTHGAIGANGALRLGDDAVTPAPVSTANPLVFAPGRVHNMNCDACITDHVDVKNAEVARIVGTALALAD